MRERILSGRAGMKAASRFVIEYQKKTFRRAQRHRRPSLMVESTTVTVHRCRFVDYCPSAITALAFPPSPLPPIKGKKRSAPSKSHIKFGTLAIGHANGNIDLCEWSGDEKELQSTQAWVVRKVCPMLLIMVINLRLFRH